MATPFKLRNGMLLLSTEAPGGVYNATQLKKIAALCDGDSALVKATEDQRLALFVQPAKVSAIAAELKAVGLGIRNYQDGLHQPTTCVGELCSEHVQDAMGAAMDVSQELVKVALESPLKIGINGCSRCCVPTHTLDISVIGDSNGYRMSLGGKNSQIPEMASFMAEGVPAAKLPKLVAKVITVYKELAQKDESLQDVMERCGAKPFIEALAPYSADAHQDDPFSGMGGDEPKAAGDDASLSEAASDDVLAGDIAPDRDIEAFDDAVDIDPGEFGSDASLEEVPISDEALSSDQDGMVMDDTELSEELMLEDAGDTAEVATGETEIDDQTLAEVSALAGESEMITDDSPVMADDSDIDLEVSATHSSDLVTADGLLEAELDTSALDLEETPAEPVAAKKAAPAAAPAAPEDDETDLETAEEVGEAEADAFEEKLNASIAEEESLPPAEDLNEGDRLKTMQLVEGGDDLPSVEAVQENLGVSDNFDNLGIDQNEDEMKFETDVDFSPEEFEADVAEAVMSRQSKPVTTIAPKPQAASAGSGFALVGFDLGADGKIALKFANGTSMALDASQLMKNGLRELTAFGKTIKISPDQGGINVEVDGVGFYVPRQAA